MELHLALVLLLLEGLRDPEIASEELTELSLVLGGGSSSGIGLGTREASQRTDSQ